MSERTTVALLQRNEHANALLGIPNVRLAEFLPDVIPEIFDGMSDDAMRLAQIGGAAIVAVSISVGAAAGLTPNAAPGPRATSEASSDSVMKIVEKIHNPKSINSPNSTSVPKTRAQIFKSFKSPLSKELVNSTLENPGNVSGGVVKIQATTTPAAIALMTKASIDNAAGSSENAAKNATFKQIEQSVIELNDLPQGKDAESTVITPEDHPIIIVPVEKSEKISSVQVAKDITASIIEAHKEKAQVEVKAAAEATNFQNPELSWIKETSVQALTSAILNSPNIKIAPSDGDQVLKSLQYSATTGKTFSYNLSHEKVQNTVISAKEMQLILYLANIKGHKIVIGAVTTGNHTDTSLHWPGQAMDIYPEIADNRNGDVNFKSPEIIAAFQSLETDTYVVRNEFGIDELIYKYPAPGTTRLKHGQDATSGPNSFDQKVIDNHEDHEHVDVKDHIPVDPEVIYNLVFALSPEEVSRIDSFNLAPDQKEFLKQAIPISKRIAAETGTNAAVDLAQAITEAGWGRAAPGNNYHGMKVDGLWNGPKQLLQTGEETRNGTPYQIKAWFKVYGSMAESFRDHAALIARAPHYADAMKNAGNWRLYLQGLQNVDIARKEYAYATSTKYVPEISGIIEDFHIAELTHSG